MEKFENKGVRGVPMKQQILRCAQDDKEVAWRCGRQTGLTAVRFKFQRSDVLLGMPHMGTIGQRLQGNL